jgi:hypothetical protein
MKYYQAPDSGSHVYIPYPFASSYKPNEPLYLTEGEFKSLALVEENYQSASLPGFYGYSSDRTTKTKALLPDFKELLGIYKPKKVFFIGDADTSLNIGFSIATLNLAKLIAPIPLFLPRLSISGRKGIDDLKESLT